MTVMYGKEFRDFELEKLKVQVQAIDETIKCVAIVANDSHASQVYIKNKQRFANQVGIEFEVIEFANPNLIDDEKLITLIETLNQDTSVHGIFVQLPLFKHLSEQKVIDHIDEKKDVDGFTKPNIAKLFLNQSDAIVGATPLGIINWLTYENISLAGKDVVIIGRSNIVGKPLALLMTNQHATVTLVHSQTKDYQIHTKQADIVVVAVGVANFLKQDDIKAGAIVIDVGINRENGKLVGDVDFDKVRQVADKVTPVPGGVGLITTVTVLHNVLKAYKLQNA